MTVAMSLASSADRGQCMGTLAANLACEPAAHAEPGADYGPEHWAQPEGCVERRNSPSMDRCEERCTMRKNFPSVDRCEDGCALVGPTGSGSCAGIAWRVTLRWD